MLVGQVADCGAVQEPRCAPPQAGHARDVHCRGDHGAGVRVGPGTFVVVQEIRDAGEVLDDPPGLVLARGRRDGLGQGGIGKLPCLGQLAFAEFLRYVDHAAAAGIHVGHASHLWQPCQQCARRKVGVTGTWASPVVAAVGVPEPLPSGGDRDDAAIASQEPG